jgi:N-acyl-phosphatidylethanolamine-hydrolysing phospholipase D
MSCCRVVQRRSQVQGLHSLRFLRMASTVKVQGLPSRNPHPNASKDHHVGNPPNSFRNPWPSFQKLAFGSLISARFGTHPEKKFVPVPEGPNGTRSKELVNVLRPDWGAGKDDALKATWIGHASFLIELPAQQGADRGVRILCDPVFSERTSPVQFLGPKRYTPTPCTLEELPDIDIVLISHDHYDHLDYATVKHIYNRRKEYVHFLAGLNNKAWFMQHVGCRGDEVTDADWWDSFHFEVKGIGSVDITCCPIQHGSGRSATNMAHTLWCSFVIEGGGKMVYFSGDTAYQAMNTPSPCPAFEQIGTVFGGFDLAMLPIGLMTPHSFMGAVHATPEQSIQIHKTIKSRLSIGMHYGTVRGGISGQYEDVRDPPRRWKAAAEKEGLWLGGGVEGTGPSVDLSRAGVGLCHVGETIAIR